MCNEKDDELTLGDWLTFLESRRNASINIIVTLFLMIVATVFVIISLFYQINKKDMILIIGLISIVIIIIIVMHCFARWLLGPPLKQAIISNDLINQIMEEKGKTDLIKLKERWNIKKKKTFMEIINEKNKK